MAEVLLQTKLNLPGLRPSLVSRPRLIAKLNQGINGKLILISAPAGFGKTTLVAEWVEHKDEDRRLKDESARTALDASRIAWLSLDDNDNDLTRFLTYLIAALQTIEPDVGETAASLLHSPQPPPIEAVITALINEIAETDTGQYVLVLDDYHLLTNTAVHQALTFLLENMPACLHLVLITRADPPLPLARWRVRGEMGEIRLADLRFTAAEAAVFLNEISGLSLATEEVETLEARSEGWIAGLQMVALSLQGREDRADFIAAFSGSHRYIFDYLTEEIIQGLSEDLQRFLLQTSILGRLRGSLCEAVTGQEQGWETLVQLEASNLFLISLDEERVWFRYHHLFAEVMANHLHRRYREQVPVLHLRAARWYRQHDLFDEAIVHALAANDYHLAAEMVEDQAEGLLKQGHLSTLASWLRRFPPELVLERPQLGVDAAWVDLLAGKLDKIESYLAAAEMKLDSVTDPVDLQGQIAAIRAHAALLLGNPDTVIGQAQQALEQLAQDNLVARCVVTYVLSWAYGERQDYPLALATLKEAARLGEEAGNIYVAVAALNTLGDVLRRQGKTAEAEQVYNRALQLGTGRRRQPLPVTAGVHANLAELSLAQDDLAGARQYAQTGLELGKRWLNAESQIACYLALARIEHGEGKQKAAFSALNRAKRLAASHRVPPARGEQIVACEEAIAAAAGVGSDQGLLDPLSERELEVLRLFAAGLSNQAIADKLIISPGTVKAHSSHIYRKLDVHNRAQAVARAGELKLL